MAQVSKETAICPYCQSPIEEGMAVIVCPSCHVPHHADCWRENGRCTTFGCDSGAGKAEVSADSDRKPGPAARVRGGRRLLWMGAALLVAMLVLCLLLVVDILARLTPSTGKPVTQAEHIDLPRRPPPQPEGINYITAEGVWRPPAEAERQVSDPETDHTPEEFITTMAQYKASEQAMAISFLLDDIGYMDTFIDAGVIDVARVTYPKRSQDTHAYFFANGRPVFIKVRDVLPLSQLNLTSDPMYTQLAQQFPALAVYAGDEKFAGQQHLDSGSQLLLFDFPLVSGDQVDDTGYRAEVGYQFWPTGDFAGMKLVKIKTKSNGQTTGTTD